MVHWKTIFLGGGVWGGDLFEIWAAGIQLAKYITIKVTIKVTKISLLKVPKLIFSKRHLSWEHCVLRQQRCGKIYSIALLQCWDMPCMHSCNAETCRVCPIALLQCWDMPCMHSCNAETCRVCHVTMSRHVVVTCRVCPICGTLHVRRRDVRHWIQNLRQFLDLPPVGSTFDRLHR